MFLFSILGLAVCCVLGVGDGVEQSHTHHRPADRVETGRLLDRFRSNAEGEPTLASPPVPEAVAAEGIKIVPVEETCGGARNAWYPGKNLNDAAGMVVTNTGRVFTLAWVIGLSIAAIPVVLLGGILVAMFVMIFRKPKV